MSGAWAPQDDFIFIEVGVFHNLKIPGLQRSLVRITCLFHIKSLGTSPWWTCVAEKEKSKTFRIAVFIAQKLSGQGKSA